jgi:cell division protein FtsB
MTKRERIRFQIRNNLEKIEQLKERNRELTKESYLLSDEEQWITQELIKKPTKTYKIGDSVYKINWCQDYKDGDTNKTISVNRFRVVKINDRWVL